MLMSLPLAVVLSKIKFSLNFFFLLVSYSKHFRVFLCSANMIDQLIGWRLLLKSSCNNLSFGSTKTSVRATE